MFAPECDWQPPVSAWAELWERDDEVDDFEPSFDDVPCASTAAVLESVDPAALSDAQLIDAMAGWGKLASWAQVRQSAVTAEFAKRRPPEWMDDGDVGRFASEEIACALSLTVRGAGSRLALAMQLDEALPATRRAWETGVLDWPRVNLIAERTTTLTAEQAREVEREILPEVVNKTTGQIRRIVDLPQIRRTLRPRSSTTLQPGRETSADNLQALCPRHHELKHDHGWTVRRQPNGSAEWTSPTGHKYANCPESR